MSIYLKRFLYAGAVFLPTVAAMPALAQVASAGAAVGDESSAIQDIVVTAQRRSESMQLVPIAISAVSGTDLTARGTTTSMALEGIVPNLTMTRTGSTDHPFLRGVGSDSTAPNDEASVATYIDGFYIAAPSGNGYSFNNIERVEVLKGPQGTLFGRNATGGVIQLITKDPTQELHSSVSAGYGNYQALELNGYITGGIAKNLAADLAIQYTDQGKGFGRDLTTGSEMFKGHNLQMRGKLKYTGETTNVTLFLDHDYARDTHLPFQQTPATAAALGGPTLGRYDIVSEKDPFQTTKRTYVGLKIEQDVGFATFVSSSFYAKSVNNYRVDADGTAAAILTADDRAPSRQLSQEFQLLGNNGTGLKWQVGAYLFDFKVANHLDLPDIGLIVDGFTKTSSVALYGQATYEILPSLSLTGGFRYTWDKSKVDGVTNAPPTVFPESSETHKAPTWRAALDYKVTPDILAYASYNRGIKSGGFSITALGTPSYKPEQLDAYEVGLKTDLFDRRLRFNISAF